MKYPDLALYRSKSADCDQFCFLESALEETANARLVLESDLRGALRQGQFELNYQPLVDLSTRQFKGAEALVRWNHPTSGAIAPDRFIPIAEDTGVINELGEWVLRTACADAAGWSSHIKLAVNLSSVQFDRSDLVGAVTNVIVDSGLLHARSSADGRFGSMLSKKDFEWVVEAILIQGEHQTRKNDPRIRPARFYCCGSSGRLRLFRQHRSL